MSKPATRQLSVFFKQALAPALVEHGFMAQGRVFRRTRKAALQIVALELWKYNDAAEARFTVELGVCYPQLLAHVAALDHFAYFRPQLARPAITECVVRQRLGFLLEPPQDRWWSCEGTADDLPAAQAIIDAISVRGLPWLDARASLAGVVSEETLGDGVLSIAAHARLGERTKAMAAATRLAGRLSFGNRHNETAILAQLTRLVDELALVAQLPAQ